MSQAASTSYNTIREGILSGRLEPGRRLTEADMVALCGHSRTPVRTALQKLEAENFITIRSCQGAQVRKWDRKETDDLFELRGLLEGHAAERAASRISLKIINKMSRIVDELDAVLASKKLMKEIKVSEFLRLNQAFHDAIIAASGSEKLRIVLTNLIEQAVVVLTARNFSLERMKLSQKQHKELLEALKSNDPVWAKSIMVSHLYAARYELTLKSNK